MSSLADVEPSVLFGICFNASISILFGLIILNWTLTFWYLTTVRVEACLARRPTSVLLLGIVTCIGTILRLPTLGCFVYNGIGAFSGSNYVVNLSLHCTTLAIPFILVFRAWLVYFDIKFSEALQDQRWTHHIDTTLQHKNCFIDNKQKYGNPKYVAVTLIIVWSLFAIAGTIVSGHRSSAIVAIALSIFTSVSLLSIVSLQLPKFDDIWRLREETRKLCITWGIMVILFFALRFFLKQEPGNMQQNIITSCHILLISLPSYFTFFWVFKRFKLPSCVCTVRHYSQSDGVGRNNLSKELSAYIDNKNIEMSELRFAQLFSEDAWLKLFARHLLHEFSIENLLFVLETHQFVTCLSQCEDSDATDMKAIFAGFAGFPSTAPQSTIVTNLRSEITDPTDANATLKKKCVAAVKLFSKYVPEDAKFSVNLSYAVRYALYETFGYLEPNDGGMDKEEQMVQKMCGINVLKHEEVQSIFDDARKEVFALMRWPFYRFKKTEAYKTRLQI